MSSSSEVFSDISSYENHQQPAIKVNVRKKVMKQSSGLQNLRKESDNVQKTFGLKPQSNTTSKISHALEVLKKFDNKYKIKTSELSNTTQVIDSSNSSPSVSVKSKLTKIQDVEPTSHQPNPSYVQALKIIEPDPSSESNRSIGSISQDKISKNVKGPNVLPEVVTVDESEDYESDFESSDSESLSMESDDAKDVDSGSEIPPSARSRSALNKPKMHSSETESSVHTIVDQESNAVENVGLFGNIRLFAFSDIGPEEVKNIDELIVPAQLKDSLSRSNSGARLTEKSIDKSNNKLQRTLEIPIPSNVVEEIHKSLDKSSDCESIAESLNNSSESDDSSEPFRANIFTMDDLEDAEKESNSVRDYGGKVQRKRNVAAATGTLLTVVEDVEELNNEDSAIQSEEHVSTDDSRPSTSDASYKSDNFSESGVKPKKGLTAKGQRENLRLSREITKNGLVSDVPSSKHSRKLTQSKTRKSAYSIDERNENLPTHQTHKKPSSAIEKGSRVTEVKSSKPTKLHLATRDVSVQTEFPESGDEFSENEPEEMARHKVRPPQPVFEALNLSWDFDIEETNNGKSPFVFQHQTFTPETIDALANQNPVEDALDQVLRQQISLTKHFMASQYKMYQTYCMSVKQLTNQYTPVTLEETKRFIRMHKKMRTNRNDQEVL